MEKVKITRNDYKKEVEKAASIYWKKVFSIDKSLSKEVQENLKTQFGKEFDEYVYSFELLPFEVKVDNEKLVNLINSHCSTNSSEKEGRTIYYGSIAECKLNHIMSDFIEFKQVHYGDYNNGWISDTLKSTVEYCEGDVNVCIYSDESFPEYSKKFIEFFENM